MLGILPLMCFSVKAPHGIVDGENKGTKHENEIVSITVNFFISCKHNQTIDITLNQWGPAVRIKVT